MNYQLFDILNDIFFRFLKNNFFLFFLFCKCFTHCCSDCGSGKKMNTNHFGKKALQKLGSTMNNSAGGGYSDFAKRQMEKFGWTEFFADFIFFVIFFFVK